MFGSLGLPEILFILVVALLIFGPRRLPEIGRTIGRALGEFRRATTDLKRTIDTEVTLEEVRQSPPSSPAPPPEKPAPRAAEPPPVEPGAGDDESSD
jgi:sec-independent protein translocase protein TatA